MSQDIKTELSHIKRKIIKTQLFGAPGAILIGLGLYGLFGANGDAFHPLLNNVVFVKNILVAGIVIEIWQLYVLIPLLKKHTFLYKQLNP